MDIKIKIDKTEDKTEYNLEIKPFNESKLAHVYKLNRKELYDLFSQLREHFQHED